jgi:hypothetical protein
MYVVCLQSSLGCKKSALPLMPFSIVNHILISITVVECVKYNIIYFSALNLKFSIGNESVCIDIYINKDKDLPPQWSIFYDCAWYSEEIEGKLVLMEYVATGNDFKEARKFSFISPATSKLGKRKKCN